MISTFEQRRRRTGLFFVAPALIVLAAIPTLLQTAAVFARPRPATCPPGFPSSIWPTYLVAYAFRYNRRFGLLFLLGLLLELLVR